MKTIETKKRTLAKTALWRFIASALTLIVAYMMFGQFFTSLAFTIVITILTTIAYYLHERFWNRVDWGKSTVVESED